jgi:uncharacterized membrane protein
MTEKETIVHIITTEKSPRTFDDYTNYFFLIAPLGFVVIGFSALYNSFRFASGLSILFFSIAFICSGILFLVFILTRLKDNITFKSISPASADSMDNVAEKLNQSFTLRKMDVNKKLGRIVAFTKITGFSWGEQITIIFDKDRVLVNSRPSGIRQPFTILKDRQNIRRLEQIL